MMGSSSDDCIYYHFGYTHSLLITLKYMQYSAIADVHTFKFTAAHELGFSVSTSRLLATDLNTEFVTSDHYKY
jgi:hypothetical protein